MVDSNRQWWLLLCLVIPLCYPQWPGGADFSIQYRPPELCEAVNDDKSCAARGGRSHRLILAEQMACKRGDGTDFYRISWPSSHRKSSQIAGTSTQLLASNKSRYRLALFLNYVKKKVQQFIVKPQYSGLPLLTASSYFKLCERCRVFY